MVWKGQKGGDKGLNLVNRVPEVAGAPGVKEKGFRTDLNARKIFEDLGDSLLVGREAVVGMKNPVH